MRRSTRWDAEFTEFVAARSPQLYRNAYLLTTSPHAAEDLVQTALAKAYAAWWRVRGRVGPGGLCARDPHQGVPLGPPAAQQRRAADRPPARGAAHAADPAQRLALMAALAELSDLDRAVVVLRFWEDRSVAETAAQLGLSVAAVRNRSLRALRSLRGLLGEDTLSGQTNGSGS